MYSPCNIISAEDAVDSVLCPTVTSDLRIVPDPNDGQVVSRTATRISVEMSLPGRKPARLCEFSEIKADVLITESRLVLHCDRFDTGTTYGGLSASGAAIGLAATAVSKIRAKGRNKGLTLVGHIRYPWLNQIGGYENRLLGNLLVASVAAATDKGPLTLKLTLFLTRGSEPIALSTNIARMAAAYDLKHEAVPDTIAPQLTDLAAGRSTAVKDKKAGTTGYVMPWSKEVISP